MLIPILFDNVGPPFGFASIQAANMVGWDGDTSKEAFQQLIRALTKVIGGPSSRFPPVEVSTENGFLPFSGRTKVFRMPSIEFVNELHERWLAIHPSEIEAEPVPEYEPDADKDESKLDEDTPMNSGAVFLSYTHEDKPTALLIRDVFKQAKIDVWFNKNPEALRIGEYFEKIIKTNIERCSLFVPIISRNTLARQPRFFRLEWKYAQQMTLRYPDSMRFIIPVVIDDTRPDDPNLDEQFRKLHWERLQDGQFRPEFLSEIRELQRVHRREIG